MEKVRVGVLGAFRGTSMINYCKIADNAEAVAICDKWKEGLDIQKKTNEGLNISYFDNFDDFINTIWTRLCSRITRPNTRRSL